MFGLEALAAALSYLVLALLLGQLVAAGYFLPNGEPKELLRSLLAGATAALLIFLTIAFAALVIQGAKLQRGFPSMELLWRYLTMTQSGKIWLARELYGALLLIFIWIVVNKGASRNLIRAAAVLSVPLVASRSLTSHAVAVREDTLLIVTADAIHLVATALWAGGLIVLWRVLRLASKRLHQPLSWITAIVNRFSRLALVSVVLLAITGPYQSWIHVGSFEILMNTDYGKMLLLKLLLFSVMLGIGALNFLSTRRVLAHAVSRNENGQAASRTALRRIGIESVIGLLIFCATGLLTVLPPGVHVAHQTAAAARLPAAKIDSAAEKSYLPAEGATVKILSPAIGAIFTGDRVPIKFRLIAGKRGHHVHAYVDGELMGMFESKAGTLNGLKPGRHTLELRVVAADHQSELDAFDRVEIMVK
jgi:copper transport protein